MIPHQWRGHVRHICLSHAAYVLLFLKGFARGQLLLSSLGLALCIDLGAVEHLLKLPHFFAHSRMEVGFGALYVILEKGSKVDKGSCRVEGVSEGLFLARKANESKVSLALAGQALDLSGRVDRKHRRRCLGDLAPLDLFVVLEEDFGNLKVHRVLEAQADDAYDAIGPRDHVEPTVGAEIERKYVLERRALEQRIKVLHQGSCENGFFERTDEGHHLVDRPPGVVGVDRDCHVVAVGGLGNHVAKLGLERVVDTIVLDLLVAREVERHTHDATRLGVLLHAVRALLKVDERAHHGTHLLLLLTVQAGVLILDFLRHL